jgi:hypothetical protein
VEPDDGFVLMDNTTILGARRAYGADSVPPSGVDPRSLTDVLEAIVFDVAFRRLG